MSLTVTQNVTEVNLTVTHESISVEINPVITKNVRNNNIDGGTP